MFSKVYSILTQLRQCQYSGVIQQVEATVLSSGTLELVEPFLSAHNPLDFASCDESMLHGQSVTSLARVVPLLSSNRREPQSLAAFHFTMEAAIKSLAKRQHVSPCLQCVTSEKSVTCQVICL